LLAIVLAVISALVGLAVYARISNRVYIEKSEISASEISLSSTTGGVLEEVFVKSGDYITANTAIARVGQEIIKSKNDGLVISLSDDIGKNFGKGETVATMIDPNELRVVGHVQEDKGLKDIQVGQTAMFKVDAFGDKKYYGVVDEISSTSHESDVVFSISDKREKKKFDIKVRFNLAEYPELKNGMSAKLWVYKK
jgi:HlyD family secretion protein